MERDPEELVRVEAWGIGAGFLDHNMLCWVCHKNKAFYYGNPRWSFAPCMECQRRYAAYWREAWWPVAEELRSRKWWQFWKWGQC